ncbi:putative lysine-specific permease transmembrane protein [Kickxella alabastrina]|uniref:putative lysine-specific permease transmembrane protein n=1 Tax=Kickxella alabastrina TaxID=61397 RepID=UPI00221F3F9E|nr:putative lysine-specific permease transmembrane protein [Kickxella alabastrina]KAI7833568.1 putative lysine-specific permease transmembrane protein [Kickxella alabastrina]
MIAIGGTIGTGLFIGSGSTLASAGPAGSLVAFLFIGSMVFFICTSLGEMSTFIPTSDPFNHFGARFLDPALGFAFGWNYWYSWMLTVGSELVACGMIVQFWLPNLTGVIWSLIVLVVIFLLNAISVKGYGESEFWMAALKVLTVFIFIIVGILTITGVTGGDFIGARNWHVEGAPFKDHIVGILKACIVAAFSFQGTEIVGVTVGESANPRRDVPRAIRSVFWRILFFYISSVLIIGLIIPNNDENLVNAVGVSDIAISPFTLVFQKAGADWAAHIMNAVVLVTILSAGNSGLYASTRVLWVLANEGKAPRLFRMITKNGVPLWALVFTTLWSTIIFCISLAGNQKVYLFLINLSGLSGMGFWVGIALCHWRFRRAYVAQGYDLDDLPYMASLFPFGPIYACCLLIIIIIGQGYGTIWPTFDALSFVSTYLAIPLFLIFWLGWKYYKKTKWVKLMDIDLVSGTLIELERAGDVEIFPADGPGVWKRYFRWIHRKSA